MLGGGRLNARQNFDGVSNGMFVRAHSGVTHTPSSVTEKPVASVAVPAARRLSNLEQFLFAVTPYVTFDYPSQMTMRGLRASDLELQPYFGLDKLWEAFREWSAYGAGVPLMLNNDNSIVQYYVPYLSGIQIYTQSEKPSVKSRQPGGDSDSDFRDSSSDGSCDFEPEKGLKYSREQSKNPDLSHEVPLCMGSLSLRDDHIPPQDGFSSDDGDFANPKGHLLFEYFEQDSPFSREPLADKISELACHFPSLMTLRSCDILPSSWISVAWYPIYRIPTGPTMKDLDACFLTYHSLHTPLQGSQRVNASMARHPTEVVHSIPRISVPVFGLASYKFKGSFWTPGGYEHQLASSLLQAAEGWLGLLNVNHPDFVFFRSR